MLLLFSFFLLLCLLVVVVSNFVFYPWSPFFIAASVIFKILTPNCMTWWERPIYLPLSCILACLFQPYHISVCGFGLWSLLSPVLQNIELPLNGIPSYKLHSYCSPCHQTLRTISYLLSLFSSTCCYLLLLYWFEPFFLLPVSLFCGYNALFDMQSNKSYYAKVSLCDRITTSITCPFRTQLWAAHLNLFSTTSNYFFSNINNLHVLQ